MSLQLPSSAQDTKVPVYLGVRLNERTRSLRGSAENEASSKPLEALEKVEAVSAQKDEAGGQSDTFG